MVGARSKRTAKRRKKRPEEKGEDSPCLRPVVCYHRLMIRTLTAQQAHDLMTRDDVEVIDVREPHEWAGGHLPGSRHVPLGQLREGPKAALTRDGVIFVCAAGIRSQTAARLAEGIGLTRVYNLAGGTRSWQSAGLPLVTDASAAA